MRTARRLMREWEIAIDSSERRAVYEAVTKFFDVPNSHEVADFEVDFEAESKESGPLSLSLHREFYNFASTLKSKNKIIRLEKKAWQDVKMQEVNSMHPDKARLVWCDPFYQPMFQPKIDERADMRKLLDGISGDGTVVLIFGRFLTLSEYWVPIFADGFNKSSVSWAVDEVLFTVNRSPSRDRHTKNFTVWHSMTESILTVVRRTKGEQKKRGILLPTRKYTPEFRAKYGPENGIPRNTYDNYKPPTKGGRLRDEYGTLLRNNAEKTTALCEYFLDLFTEKGELVVDLYAGTATMGLACIKSGRLYYGTDTASNVVTAAHVRLAKLLLLRERGDFTESMAVTGLEKTVAEQVAGITFLLPEDNVPCVGVNRQTLVTNPVKNFGLFTPQEAPIDHNLIVKETRMKGDGGLPLGKGVFTAVERKAGDWLPLIVWGKIMPMRDHKKQLATKGEPDLKGCFALYKPYSGMAVVLDDRCPARYVNDARGIPSARVNVHFIQHANPRELFNDENKGLHLLLQAKTAELIPAGGQLFMDYGDEYWLDNTAIIGHVTETQQEEDMFSDEEALLRAEEEKEKLLEEEVKLNAMQPEKKKEKYAKKKTARKLTMEEAEESKEADVEAEDVKEEEDEDLQADEAEDEEAEDEEAEDEEAEAEAEVAETDAEVAESEVEEEEIRKKPKKKEKLPQKSKDKVTMPPYPVQKKRRGDVEDSEDETTGTKKTHKDKKKQLPPVKSRHGETKADEEVEDEELTNPPKEKKKKSQAKTKETVKSKRRRMSKA